VHLLAAILRGVHHRQRLRDCARVSSSMHAAAVAATDHVDVIACTHASHAALMAYLAAHGRHVTSLMLAPQPTLAL
jgi:hypothetical protein